MLADREDSRKMAVPTPTVAAAAGTLIYQNSYGDTETPAEVLVSDEEVDYMPDGNIIISRPSKGSKSAEPEATQNHNDAVAIANYHNNSIAKSGGKTPGKNQSSNDEAVASNQSGNDNAVVSSDYAVASADYHFETRGSGRTRKPPAKKL